MPITYRLLKQADAEIFDSFLAPHSAEAFFLRSNARQAGMEFHGKTAESDIFGAFNGDKLIGALAYSWLTTLLFFAEDHACLTGLAETAKPYINARGGACEAFLGLRDQALIVIDAFHLGSDVWRDDKKDFLFKLPLPSLALPPQAADPRFSIRTAQPTDKALLIPWRIAFNIESVGATPGPALDAKVKTEIDRRVGDQSLFVLEKEGAIVSFCGVSGHLDEAKMVGPVWTPPEYRGRAYAKTCVGLALQKIATAKPSLREAVLFADRPDAIHLYETLGFKKIADWRLAFLKDGVKLA